MSQNKIKEANPLYNSDWRAREETVKRAIAAAVLDHKRAGNPIAVWRDGKVVIIPPEEIEVTEEETL